LIENPAGYRRNIPAFLSFLIHLAAYRLAVPFCAGKAVLDIGAFIGYGEKLLAPHARRIMAIDRAAAALEFARAGVDLSNVRFRQASAGRLPFPDGSFETVLGFQVIEHLPPGELSGFLREVRRVTLPGGRLILVTPRRAFRLLPFQRPFNRDHYREFSPAGLRRALRPFYDEIRLEGVRAAGWLEALERKRVRQSPLRVYLRDPLRALAGALIPPPLRDRLRGTGTPAGPGSGGSGADARFAAFSRSVSLEDFYLAGEDLSGTIDLFAVCRKR